MNGSWSPSSSPLRKGDVIRVEDTVYDVTRATKAGAVVKPRPSGRSQVISLCSDVERKVKRGK